MSEKEMPQSFWVEVVHTTIHIINSFMYTQLLYVQLLSRGCTYNNLYHKQKHHNKALYNLTLNQQFTSRIPDVLYVKVFGCIAYIHVLDELRTTLDPKAEKSIFVGYSLEQEGYYCYNPITHDICVSKYVVFKNLKSWYRKHLQQRPESNMILFSSSKCNISMIRRMDNRIMFYQTICLLICTQET